MIKDPSDVPPENEDFMQRLWAYLTVKQLLERQVLLQGQEKEDEEKEALKLSLKYQFVTPLTSMVVTKPQKDEVEVADKPKEGGEDPRPPACLLPSVCLVYCVGVLQSAPVTSSDLQAPACSYISISERKRTVTISIIII
ncbi:inter-alpha-trypsin inhibitor heavy chain H3-like isoform X1 [Megalobrama amblycephala]|uniref:inter-alpha-trypsin inhibitor heavy chain H3-like isoform X1 n=1 Tax=Megalobrama amblycephala TaxID=75352 RepID=UPI0020146A68|nr:inter-alpha-trypsin inhibitor heavy chain H3-like isoform X1 [Megalobrama amblycephala]